MKTKQHSDDRDSHQGNNIGHKIIVWVISLLIILAIVLGIMGHHYVKTALQPLNSDDNTKIEVNIPMGASNSRIGSILQSDNVIKSGFVFGYYARSHNINNLRSGYYRFSPSMTLGQIADKLKVGGASQPYSAIKNKIIVRPGGRLIDVSDLVAARTNLSKQRFLTLANDAKFVKQLARHYPKLLTADMRAKHVRYRLEGYLAPGTYNAKGLDEKQLLTKMVDKTAKLMQPYYHRTRKIGLTVHELLTVASFLDQETVGYHNKQIISGIIYNRLNYNLNLDSKPALNYALQSNNHTFTAKQRRHVSPYNLFLNLGTGAGPINSPSLESIQAALYPAEQSRGYLYYLYNAKNQKLYYSQNYIAQ